MKLVGGSNAAYIRFHNMKIQFVEITEFYAWLPWFKCSPFIMIINHMYRITYLFIHELNQRSLSLILLLCWLYRQGSIYLQKVIQLHILIHSIHVENQNILHCFLCKLWCICQASCLLCHDLLLVCAILVMSVICFLLHCNIG